MKIECKLKRNGGTKVDIGGIEYHFEPLSDGAHVSEVENADHIDTFLAIGEGYRVYHGEQNPEGKPQTIAAAVGVIVNPEEKTREGSFLHGSSEHAAQYTIGDVTYSLGDVVRKSFESSQLSEDDWNELEDEDRAARIDITLDSLQEAYELSQINQPSTPTPEPEPAAPETIAAEPPVAAAAPEVVEPAAKAPAKAPAKPAAKKPAAKKAE